MTDTTERQARYAYEQATGKFFKDGTEICVGYSGWGADRNNPELEDRKGLGPIPKGHYLIGTPYFSGRVGPLAMRLTPVGHVAHHRTALLIHGDNATRTASKGCVILPRVVRTEIAGEVERGLTYLYVF